MHKDNNYNVIFEEETYYQLTRKQAFEVIDILQRQWHAKGFEISIDVYYDAKADEYYYYIDVWPLPTETC